VRVIARSKRDSGAGRSVEADHPKIGRSRGNRSPAAVACRKGEGNAALVRGERNTGIRPARFSDCTEDSSRAIFPSELCQGFLCTRRVNQESRRRNRGRDISNTFGDHPSCNRECIAVDVEGLEVEWLRQQIAVTPEKQMAQAVRDG